MKLPCDDRPMSIQRASSVAVTRNRVVFLEVASARKIAVTRNPSRGRAASSVGRALRSQRRGREFEPPAVHQFPLALRLFPLRLAAGSSCLTDIGAIKTVIGPS